MKSWAPEISCVFGQMLQISLLTLISKYLCMWVIVTFGHCLYLWLEIYIITQHLVRFGMCQSSISLLGEYQEIVYFWNTKLPFCQLTLISNMKDGTQIPKAFHIFHNTFHISRHQIKFPYKSIWTALCTQEIHNVFAATRGFIVLQWCRSLKISL